jgi:integrase
MMPRRRNEEIKVHVASYGAGRNLCLRYRDPRTGKPVAKTAGTRNRKEAQKEAGKWEEELRSGRYKPASKTTWDEFRQRYESEVVAVEMKRSTAAVVAGIFDAVERIVGPDLLAEMDADAIELLKRTLREERTTRGEGDKTVEEITRRSEETVRGHLRVIKAALKWAYRKGIVNECPEIEITAAAGSKGRPITQEEFERMIAKLRGDDLPEGAKRIRPLVEVPLWERFLWGCWWSGLRLEEAMVLSWDDPDAPRVDLDGENSTITIPGDRQKGGKETVGPIVPEFYELLVATPVLERTGLVFPMPSPRKDFVSKEIRKLGKAAGVKVSAKKCASIHDLRRSFGFRWAVRVMPVVLQKLMRHASIETTLKYYVGNDAREMGKAVWQAFRTAARPEPSPAREGVKEATQSATLPN